MIWVAAKSCRAKQRNGLFGLTGGLMHLIVAQARRLRELGLLAFIHFLKVLVVSVDLVEDSMAVNL